jgi:hypothetical protein
VLRSAVPSRKAILDGGFIARYQRVVQRLAHVLATHGDIAIPGSGSNQVPVTFELLSPSTAQADDHGAFRSALLWRVSTPQGTPCPLCKMEQTATSSTNICLIRVHSFVCSCTDTLTVAPLCTGAPVRLSGCTLSFMQAGVHQCKADCLQHLSRTFMQVK